MHGVGKQEFFWGAATSAHQVEGGNRNDWTEWEKNNAQRATHGAKERTWPDYLLGKHPSPLQEENYISGRAADHYHRFREDFDIARSLGHNAHRFSIEWSRVEPEEGVFDERAIGHYRDVVRALRERGMEPFVTLWHWTLPLWLRDRGGVCAAEFPELFARYAKRMAEALPEAAYWITENETNVYTGHGYWRGVWPPEIRSFRKFFLAYRRLARAHRTAYMTIRTVNSAAQVGVAHNMLYFTRFPAALKSFFWNRLFLNSIRDCQDFVGINYYKSDRIRSAQSDMGWGIDPEGLYRVIRETARFRKPILILENGIADARDAGRSDFIASHIQWMKKAMAEGADVRGYFHWSLVDNFEWDKGFWPRFGLVEIDYQTMERKIRPSARVLQKLLTEHSDAR